MEEGKEGKGGIERKVENKKQNVRIGKLKNGKNKII